jgi:hypothetical protein
MITIKNNKEKELINNCITDGEHLDFAKLMYYKFNSQFVCISKNKWEFYDGNTWIKDDGYLLRIKISDEFREIFIRERSKIMIKNSSQLSVQRQKQTKKKIKILDSIIKKLAMFSFKNGIMKECCNLFHDEHLIFSIKFKVVLKDFRPIPRDLHKIILRYSNVYG